MERLTETIRQMDMPFTVQLVYAQSSPANKQLLVGVVARIAAELAEVEQQFSPFLETSWVSRHPQPGEPRPAFWGDEAYQDVLTRCLAYEQLTEGRFNPFFSGAYNPTGLVKGWAVERAFYRYLFPLLQTGDVMAAALNGAGDMQVGVAEGASFQWQIGIENPCQTNDMLTQLSLQNGAVATSGYSQRGKHIVGAPADGHQQVSIIDRSLTHADVMATVGLASTPQQFERFIATQQLSGLLVDCSGQVRQFHHGGFIC